MPWLAKWLEGNTVLVAAVELLVVGVLLIINHVPTSTAAHLRCTHRTT